MNDSIPVLDDDVVDRLKSLIQIDVDATIAYSQALAGIDDEHSDIRAQLEQFKDDHVRHVEDLSNALAAFGHDPPEPQQDVKGFVIAGMTAIRSKLGTRQTLKAMRQNELLTNKMYDAAMEGLVGLPEQIADAIVRGRADERRHLDAIERALMGFDEAERDLDLRRE
jgi:demethoxyubiquinone hydroxylase (CLK1/Coq7/Cat5 family)